MQCNTIAAILAVTLAATALLRSQGQPADKKNRLSESLDFTAPGTVIKGFQVPRFDLQGALIGKLSGDTATYQDSNNISVQTIHYVGLKEGKPDFEFSTPYCNYNQAVSVVNTDAPVKFTRQGVSLNGLGLTWDISKSKGTIHKEVTMVIHDINKGIK